MNSFWCNFLPIVVGIGAALLGGLIGWHLRRRRVKELEYILDEKNAEYVHVKNAHEMLDIRYNNLQKEHVSLSVSHNTLGEKKNVLETELTDLSTSHNTLQEKVEVLEEDLAAIESAKAVLTKHFVNYRTTAENRLEELGHANLEGAQKHNFLLTRYESQNNRIIELENIASQWEDDYNNIYAEKQQVANSLTELQSLNEEKENSYQSLLIQHETNVKHRDELQSLTEKWENNYHTLVEEHEISINCITELQALNDEKESQHLLIINQLEINSNRIAELQALNDEKENSYVMLVAQHEESANRISELQQLNDDWKQANASLNNQLESKEKQLAELEETNKQWAAAFEKLENEQGIAKARIETLQQALASIEELNDVKYANSDSSIKLYEKELGELQDAKAQLEITRIKLENELDILRGTHSQVLTEYNALLELEKASRMRLDYLEQQNFEQRIAVLETELVGFKTKEGGSENGHTIMAAPIEPDDLKVVEGIGPKIEAVLHDAGILTFEQLAKTDPERIHAILDAAGPRYRIHNPSTWPTQAELAAKNDWDKLKELKEYLLAGRDRATQ